MGRPLAAPPGVPPDRIAALRAAFDATLTDPGFMAEADKTQMEIDPLSGADIERLLAAAYGQPQTIVRRAGELVDPHAIKAD
jgi:tripartite-type tricarboxylate transporter receptor subunit TctC